MQVAVVLDHLLAGSIGGRCDVGLERRHGDVREQRQVVLVAGAAQRPHRPQRIAAVEAERAERVGCREPFQRRGLEAGAQPEVADGIEARAAALLSMASPSSCEKPLIWRKPSRNAWSERMSPPIAAWRGCRRAARRRRRLERAVPVGVLISTGRTSTPCSCASRTICAGA